MVGWYEVDGPCSSSVSSQLHPSDEIVLLNLWDLKQINTHFILIYHVNRDGKLWLWEMGEEMEEQSQGMDILVVCPSTSTSKDYY
jgi:hypothetical protein